MSASAAPSPPDTGRAVAPDACSLDAGTLAFYEANAAEYADRISRSEPDGDLKTFIRALPPRALPVLDWGCGPGNSAALLEEAGISCVATDASPAMAGIAAGMGVAVRIEPFEALEPLPRFRGIWANFSLMHAPRSMFAALVGRAAAALVPGGVLHLGQDTAACGAAAELPEESGLRMTFCRPEEMMEAVTEAGLVPVSARSGTHRGLGGTSLDFHILLARKPE